MSASLPAKNKQALIDDVKKLDGWIEVYKESREIKLSQIYEIEGACPLCDNFHYPHCGSDQDELAINPIDFEKLDKIFNKGE